MKNLVLLLLQVNMQFDNPECAKPKRVHVAHEVKWYQTNGMITHILPRSKSMTPWTTYQTPLPMSIILC
jgi:hypothetical protein